MAKKICVRCSTENAEHYRFCKNCGASLPVVDKFKQSGYDYAEGSNGKQEGYAYPADFKYDSVSSAELEAYVGEGKEKICRKFFSMELLGKKASWHWPIFLFGILFGFFGMSFWFFSRKMFKIGLVLALVGAIFMCLDTAVNLEANRAFWGDYQTVMQSVVEAKSETDFFEVSRQFDAAITRYEANYNPVISVVSNYIGSMFLPIILGAFGLYLYKNKAIKGVKKVKEKYPEDELLMARIAASGGRKIYLVLIPVAMVLVCGFLSLGLIII